MNKVESSDLQRKLPPRLARLEELAYNLWWAWHRASRDLFKQLDRTLWTTTRHNPVRILREIPQENLNALAKDPIFLRDFDAVMMEMDKDTHGSMQWYSKNPIAYMSAEFGLHISLPIYSGGLGVLSGDHTKEASDMGLPFVAVG
ncbi:MAG: DUF3417 domain-containing protein, partial [Anaerolineae bacterium]|nr:DUF3417 domain-containing protein [Anaerolineae bacterium]